MNKHAVFYEPPPHRPACPDLSEYTPGGGREGLFALLFLYCLYILSYIHYCIIQSQAQPEPKCLNREITRSEIEEGEVWGYIFDNANALT